MKQIKLFIISIFMSFFFAGCSDVGIVKGGTLNFDNSITVGEAFDKYSYFLSTSWKDFETSNGRKIVEVNGVFTDEYLKLMQWKEKFIKASLIVQFKINKDDTFEIAAIGFEFTGENGKTEKIDAGKDLTDAQLNNLLKELYDDKPLS